MELKQSVIRRGCIGMLNFKHRDLLSKWKETTQSTHWERTRYFSSSPIHAFSSFFCKTTLMLHYVCAPIFSFSGKIEDLSRVIVRSVTRVALGGELPDVSYSAVALSTGFLIPSPPYCFNPPAPSK
eukprot:scaffold39136_cov29-Cyclotella_meneghiniana.AAC.2